MLTPMRFQRAVGGLAISAGMPSESHTGYRMQALELYRQAWLRGVMRRARATLMGKRQRLESLAAAGDEAQIAGRHYAGRKTVPLARICGSDNRCADYDAGFHPVGQHTRDRWVNVAVARFQGIPLPPIDLIKIGEQYYVLDGHNRVSVAKALRQRDIEAEVTVWERAEA